MNIAVVGCNRGVGRVLCLMLADRGHTVIAGGRRFDQIEEFHDKGILTFPMDVTNEQQLQEAAAGIEKEIGKLDAVVHCAGILLDSDRMESLMEQRLEDVGKHFEVNALGVLASFRSFYRVLKKGAIFIAVTSEGGSFTCAGKLYPSYGISKTAANKIVQTLRFTVDDVEIVAVHPGRVNTDMGKDTAQIEPEESATGFCDILEGKIEIRGRKQWFFDYLGNEMPL